jgi:hypothetical protein
MAARKKPTDKFRERLGRLSRAVSEDLRLPSLEANRLEGYAYLFRIVLPLLNAIRDDLLASPGVSILS